MEIKTKLCYNYIIMKKKIFIIIKYLFFQKIYSKN